jgi:hypothetical protein
VRQRGARQQPGFTRGEIVLGDTAEVGAQQCLREARARAPSRACDPLDQRDARGGDAA